IADGHPEARGIIRKAAYAGLVWAPATRSLFCGGDRENPLYTVRRGPLEIIPRSVSARVGRTPPGTCLGTVSYTPRHALVQISPTALRIRDIGGLPGRSDLVPNAAVIGEHRSKRYSAPLRKRAERNVEMQVSVSEV